MHKGHSQPFHIHVIFLTPDQLDVGQPNQLERVSLLMRAKENTGSPVLAAKVGALFPLHSPGTGLQDSVPRPRDETGQAIKWATYRGQANYTEQPGCRKAIGVPRDENNPAVTIEASGQQRGAAAQDLNLLCTESKAGA